VPKSLFLTLTTSSHWKTSRPAIKLNFTQSTICVSLQIIKENILSAFPDHDFLGKEASSAALDNDCHRDELFSAIRGRGAFLNVDRIAVGLDDAIATMGSPPATESMVMSLKGVLLLLLPMACRCCCCR
jgi:fructose-1,6-bisphosphatase/inositol monophosphatase family enzyme